MEQIAKSVRIPCTTSVLHQAVKDDFIMIIVYEMLNKVLEYVGLPPIFLFHHFINAMEEI